MTKLLLPAEVPPLAIRASDLKAAALRYAKAFQDPAEAQVHAALVATPSVASQVVLVQILDYIDQRYWSSTDRIGQILAALRGAPDVKTVILEIDSPGGSVYGVHELAKQIRALRAQHVDADHDVARAAEPAAGRTQVRLESAPALPADLGSRRHRPPASARTSNTLPATR